ncbi:adaptin N terminal region-domain-containing protein [Catenaria anguillulae PL171]|uniref:AP-1 complex subunit gamma n=1 Tax=Catenaria anguillulae PL171 TaxID=765915 RepID=A0A1Y2HYL4_9FUNG|nr:adaptin N terminal region-domain-containing protein [Catenaria anguillulae PL171]
MVTKLKDFIKRIRSCKTAADERAVVAKESADIRTMFKEENVDNRHANVAKLLYIHMLGYPAHFGQMECVKLVASPRFADKRLGYLGIMLLLDENQETLTLVTNSLKNDMNHPNMYVVGLALCTLGNISSIEMARDLCPEVEKLLGSSNSYIRKKAALSAVRIIRKVPDLLDNFASRCRAMLGERNHGALLTGLTLIHEMCKISPAMLAEFRGTVPVLVKILKQLITTGYSPEHDVQGITDPFLQVKILRLMRLLGKGDAAASEQMNDVLAQVASNTDGSKNVGNAILYETVLTILDIQADQTLRVLAISILGRFLSNKDNNIRYVALQTLIRTITIDVQAVQRHRSTVLDCLHDPDVSIRRRALELAFALVNATNVRVMTRELLSFLEVADAEFRTSMVTDIAAVADRYAPNKRWHLDTLVRVMKAGGEHVRDDIVSQFVKLATNAPDLQGYATHKLYGLLKQDASQDGLVHAAVWSIGEFGDSLVQPAPLLGVADPDDAVDAQGATVVASGPTPTESDVVGLLESILVGAYITPVTKQYVLVALMKLSTRFSNASTVAAIKSLLAKYKTSMNMELQQRSVEFTNMFDLDAGVRQGLWERMPVQEMKDDKYATNAAAAAAAAEPSMGGAQAAAGAANPAAGVSALLDLEGLSLGSSPPKGGAGAGNVTSPRDLLADIFSSPAPGASAAAAPSTLPPKDPLAILMGLGAPAPSAPAPAPANPLADILGGAPLAPSNPTSPAAAVAPAAAGIWDRDYPAHKNADVTIVLKPMQVTDPSAGQLVQVIATITNHGAMTGLSDLQLLVAVPKTHKIAMAPMSTNALPSVGAGATQAFRILNPERKQIKLRLKLVYNAAGRAVDEVVNFAFPDAII